MNVGISLSTVREYISDNKSFLDTCKLLKEMGYTSLGYSSLNIDINRMKKEINEVNLPISIAFISLDKVLNETLKVMKDFKEFNCFNVGIESLSVELIKNEKRLKQTIKSLDEVAKILNQNNYKLCYHFTSNDFVKFNGINILDYMLENTKFIYFVFDPFYIHYSGYNIEEYLLKMKNKIEVIYLNDYQIIFDNNEAKPLNTLVGQGSINYKELLPIFKKISCKNYIVNNSLTKTQFMKIKDTFDIIEKWK